MDTRTPRPSTGGTPRGFVDDEPVLSTVKVPSDPGQVVVNHVSFRVLLARPAPRSTTLEEPRLRAASAVAGLGLDTVPAAAAPVGARTAAVPAAAGAGTATGTRTGRRRPVVWSGRTAPGDAGADRLLQAVRVPPTGLRPAEPEAANATTQTLPRIDEASPTIVGPREPGPSETAQPPQSGVRPPRGAGDAKHGSPGGPGEPAGSAGPHTAGGPARPGNAGESNSLGDDAGRTRTFPAAEGEAKRKPRRNDPVRHAYYPGRRMNLGVVLLPLRILLGFVSVYAGMGKLCDPVYFDGGDRGSMVTWLRSLEPWSIAGPLHDFAVTHPVGAGLTVAFLQVIVGVLTLFGLWQRLAAGVGAALSVALLVTVAWRSVPVYDAPDMLYLAAWSPLIIAGAPVYSLDGRLAGEAWRTLGPRAGLWDLRRRVLRRGALLSTLVIGLALLLGAVLGGAVRSPDVPRVPGPGEPPVNHLPGSPLPEESGKKTRAAAGPGTRSPEASRSPGPSASSAGTPSGPTGAPTTPSQRETAQAPVRPAAPAAPEQPAAPSTTGAATTGPSGDHGASAAGGADGGGPGGRSEPGGALGGLLG